ncbi:MAG: MoxR family ATPase, partial [Campylobacterales bacterium]|nr:MoxR family ATPase [Campylobacterales bacterium]
MITPEIGTARLKKELDILLDINVPVFIHGSPGIGKSYIVNELASTRGWQISDVRLSQLDSVDLRGIPSIVNGKTVWMPPIFLPTEGTGILFLDELNSATPSVQAAIYQLILDRKIGEYSMPKDWRIVCAGNRVSDRGIVFRLPSPLANRMVHLVAGAKFEDFKVWAIQNGLHPTIVAFLGFRPDLLSQEAPKEAETNPAFATPRSWTMLSKIAHSADNLESYAPLIYGAVGYGAGIEFLSYLKTYAEIPDVDAILRGEEVPTPTNPGALYALTAALVERWDGSQMKGEALLAYSKVLPVEFGVMLVKDLVVK